MTTVYAHTHRWVLQRAEVQSPNRLHLYYGCGYSIKIGNINLGCTVAGRQAWGIEGLRTPPELFPKALPSAGEGPELHFIAA